MSAQTQLIDDDAVDDMRVAKEKEKIKLCAEIQRIEGVLTVLESLNSIGKEDAASDERRSRTVTGGKSSVDRGLRRVAMANSRAQGLRDGNCKKGGST